MRHRTQNYGLVFSMISSVTLAALKLMGVVDWSWWVVASPIWIPAVLMVAGLALVTTFMTFEYEDIKRKVRGENE